MCLVKIPKVVVLKKMFTLRISKTSLPFYGVEIFKYCWDFELSMKNIHTENMNMKDI